MTAKSIGEFAIGDQVFVLQSAATPTSPADWLGVEIVEIVDHDEAGSTVHTAVAYTGGIPGYEIGERVDLDENVIAHRELTVPELAALVAESRDTVEVPAGDDHAGRADGDDDGDDEDGDDEGDDDDD